MKILVVEDDIWINKLIAKILEVENYQIYKSFNGKEALKILAEKPDIKLIITDIIMPEKEGIETIMEIRKKYSDKKIIAMSGGGKVKPKGYLSLAKKIGADEVIQKPFDGDDLIKLIKKLI